MRILNPYLISILIIVFAFTSCSSDNECDNVCPDGQVQLLDCTCEILTSSNPCAVVTCPTGFFCDGGTCVSDGGAQIVDVSGEISEDMIWTTGNEYILNDRVTVTSGVTLTIEPGVVVKGVDGTGADASALLIARGATLNAMGTAAMPIIFTASSDEIVPGEIIGSIDPTVNGLWGGLMILGNAPVSASNDAGDVTEVQIEGIPTSDPNGLYGGDDPNDSSGNIQFISIRHGGTNIGEGNEINGLTLGGVGSGTVIENVEVVGNQDDGIEFFGGTVNITNAVLWNCGDDSMDTDQAWNGTVDNFIIVTPTGGSAFELDGPEGSLSQGPGQFVNGTVFSGSNIDHLVDWDETTNCGVSNIYFFGIEADYDPAVAFETWGGDGSGNTGSFEFSAAAGFDGAGLIATTPEGALTEVPTLMNTVGADASSFAWTFASQVEGLAAIGL